MKKSVAIVFLLLLLIVYPSLVVAQGKERSEGDLIARGAVLIKAGTGYLFTEGPAVDPNGNVFFTDQPNDKIMKWSTDGTISMYMEGAGRSNGLYFDPEGNLLSCADLNNEIWMIDKDKKATVLVKDFGGKKLNGPNDLWVDPKGGIYFTDPFYKRNYWTRTEKEMSRRMFITYHRTEKALLLQRVILSGQME